MVMLEGLGGIATVFWFRMVVECMRRSDRDWIFVVVFLGPLGGLAYFIVNILPQTQIRLPFAAFYSRKRIRSLEAQRHLGLTLAQQVELGDLHFGQRQYQQAAALYQEALASDSEMESPRINLAKCFAELKQAEQGVAVLQPLIERKKGYYSESARVVAGELLTKLGKFDEALAMLQPLYHPAHSAQIQVAYASCLAGAGRKEEAAAALEKLLLLEPASARADRPWFAQARRLLKTLKH